jgi:uncharacterized membrane protein YphA (DoxX/SURF4 family)
MKKSFVFLVYISSILLGLFFVYKGLTKHFLSPCKVYGSESTIPIAYQQVISNMCQSGMLKVVGLFQIVAGLLLLIPRTRLFGAIVLLPVIFNIFILHLFMDNRPEELIETGIPLTLTLFIIIYDFNIWKSIFFKRHNL